MRLGKVAMLGGTEMIGGIIGLRNIPTSTPAPLASLIVPERQMVVPAGQKPYKAADYVKTLTRGAASALG